MESEKEFNISLKEYKGIKISPAKIPITLLDSYFSDLKKFIVGNSNEKGISIAFSDDSLKTTVTASAVFIAALTSDVEAIQRGNISHDNVRFKTIANLQKYVKKNNAIVIIGEETMPTPLSITPTSNIGVFTNYWVDFETYTFGTIRDMGGASPNIHVVDENNNEIKIASTQELLRSIKENILYTKKLIRYTAQRNIQNNELRNLNLISIEDLPKFNETEFNHNVEKGTKEWDGIKAEDFMREMRLDKEEE